jgi:peptidoglycan hydrolase-like protein with peptidoglycan-binding domain/muramidase (phage lysozyme)
MGKVGETIFSLFFNSNREADSSQRGGVRQNSFFPDFHPANLFFESGKYRQTSFFAANNTTFATGSAQEVTARSTPEELLRDPRVRAMLDVLGFAEGTGNNYGRVVFGTVLGPSNRNAPYNRSLVGRRNVVVDDFTRHPNLAVRWANGQPPSSAAGRYQFLYGTWQGLNMPDFSPHSQDIAAIKLMQRRGMIEPLLRGDFAGAIHRGAPEWASLPVSSGGSYYGGQGAKTLSSLRQTFNNSFERYHGTTAPPENPTPTTTARTLAIGQRGEAVEHLQDRLIRLGLLTEAQKNTGAGIFGPRTETAVKRFQGFAGLEQSGRYDAATRAAMDTILSADIKKGAHGGIVAELQDNLVRLGFMTRAEVNTGRGIFGPKTDNALRRFQAEHNLTRDGVYGADTFHALVSASPRTNENSETEAPVNNGRAPEYRRWNVYSTGNRAARLSDGYEDLQPHHDYQSVNYVMRGLSLTHRLEARDIVLTRSGQSNFGQAVPSPLAGRVLFAGNENDGYGNKVVVQDERTGQIMMVGHLQSVNVRRGQTVAYGQNLGGQGSTGHSSGAHVHINADASVIRRWVADLADGKFDGVRGRFDVG